MSTVSNFLESLNISAAVSGFNRSSSPPGSNTGGKYGKVAGGAASLAPVPAVADPHFCLSIDTLTISFDGHSFFDDVRFFSPLLEKMSNCSLTVGSLLRSRYNGYPECWSIESVDAIEPDNLGWLGVSRVNDHMRGRWCLHLTSVGCAFLLASGGYLALSSQMQNFNGKITRCDIALDDLYGFHSVNDTLTDYVAEKFCNAGRMPTARYIANSHNKGNTLYVGVRANGKMFRCYEKGKQLGDVNSPWVRHELELRGKDRTIPFEIFEKPAEFLKGAYPNAFSWMPASFIFKIPTHEKRRITFSKLYQHVKNQSGKFINYLIYVCNMDSSDIVESLRNQFGHYPSNLESIDNVANYFIRC